MTSKAGTFFDRGSIRYPLARLIIAAFLVGACLALLSNALLVLGNVRNDIRRTLSDAANAAGTAASAAVVFNDAKAAQESLRMFEVYPEILAVGLYTGEGTRIAGYGDLHLLPAAIHDDTVTTKDIPLLADTTSLSLPIMAGDSVVGTVYLQARLRTYWRTYLTSLATTVLISALAGALALILAMRFLDHIILPIQRLAEAAHDARMRKDFRPRGIPTADDEIGDLVRNFNALLAEVEASRKSQQTRQKELGEQVAARTAELLAAKESADLANDAKTRFLAAASHDLRQPIHAMRLFVETLSQSPLNSEQRKIADYLALSTRNLSEILNTLLDISRLDSGRITARLAAVPAYELIHNIESEFAPVALAKGLRFKLFIPVHEQILYTDAKLLHSLLRNIIDNAIKYTESGGVMVGFRSRRDSVLIQVWDTGIGIEPDHLANIFDEYYQVGNPQRDRTKGLGLGLSIAKRMAEILDIRIVCHSRPHKGSLFELKVPLADAQTASTSEVPSLPPLGTVPLTGKSVVVVEDDTMAAKALELSLKAYGMQVATFSSAEQALGDTRIDSAEYFVVDYRLPGLNGLQFLEAAQKRVPHIIKAALVTGETCDDEICAEPACCWKVLHKPIDLTDLIRVFEAQSMEATTAKPANAS